MYHSQAASTGEKLVPKCEIGYKVESGGGSEFEKNNEVMQAIQTRSGRKQLKISRKVGEEVLVGDLRLKLRGSGDDAIVLRVFHHGKMITLDDDTANLKEFIKDVIKVEELK